VQTVPWSQVFVDGRFVRNTPVMGLELSAGIHRITLVSDMAAVRVTEAVQIRPGQSATLVRRLR
jgi:hypothetical protein